MISGHKIGDGLYDGSLHETSFFVVLPAYVEIIIMR